jgi:hypothetical protein
LATGGRIRRRVVPKVGRGLSNPLNFLSFCLRARGALVKLPQAAVQTGTPPDEGESE